MYALTTLVKTTSSVRSRPIPQPKWRLRCSGEVWPPKRGQESRRSALAVLDARGACWPTASAQKGVVQRVSALHHHGSLVGEFELCSYCAGRGDRSSEYPHGLDDAGPPGPRLLLQAEVHHRIVRTSGHRGARRVCSPPPRHRIGRVIEEYRAIHHVDGAVWRLNPTTMHRLLPASSDGALLPISAEPHTTSAAPR